MFRIFSDSPLSRFLIFYYGQLDFELYRLFSKAGEHMKIFEQSRIGMIGIILSCCIAGSLIASDPKTPKATQEVNREKLLMLMSGEWVSRGLYVATKLEIADHLQSSPKSIEDLSHLTQCNPESLYRLLHMLAGFGIFEEVSPGVFSNTETSNMLAKTNPDTLNALSIFYGEEIHKSWEELLPSIQTGTPAFQLAYKQPVFSYFKENPSRAKIFQEAMKEKSTAVIKSASSTYDFNKVGSVYDIGGGYGQFMQNLLQNHPNMQGMVFDLPEVIAAVRQRTPQLENERFKLVSGDFFVSVPEGGDVYLLKSVLHDWDDENSEKILKNCYQAMHSTSRLLIVEVVLHPKDLSQYANCMDILMLAVTGGKERSLDSFKQMLENSGFVLKNVYPTSTEFSILEARKREI